MAALIFNARVDVPTPPWREKGKNWSWRRESELALQRHFHVLGNPSAARVRTEGQKFADAKAHGLAQNLGIAGAVDGDDLQAFGCFSTKDMISWALSKVSKFRNRTSGA